MYKRLSVPAVVVLLAVGYGCPTVSQAQPAPVAAVADASGPEAPAPLAQYGSGWVAKGTGDLRFFGFKAYDATLWVTNAQTPFTFSKPFALDIRYATAVKAKDISNTSLIELQRISTSSPEQIASWSAFMDSVFVDVKPGDHLLGIHLPNAGVRFFYNGKLVGESADVAFSEAFFKIWLDAKTRRKDLRSALLGLPAESRSY